MDNLKVKYAKFITSAVDKRGYPPHFYPEIAFIGRSNVGKSSLINMVLNHKNLAKVSSTPGKTTLINFFSVNDQICFVDLPGYGFAKRSAKEVNKWAEMIHTYLNERLNLILFYLLLDIRRVPNENDLMILDWLREGDKNFKIILTKMDKVNQKTKSKQLKIIEQKTGVERKDMVFTSSLKKSGRDKILENIAHIVYPDGVLNG